MTDNNSLVERLSRLSPEQRALLELRLKQETHNHYEHTSIQRRQNNTSLPLSISQERLWFLHQIEPETPIYNIPCVVQLKGELKTHILAQGLNMVVQRHEALRTNFTVKDRQPIQLIKPSLSIPLDYTNLMSEPASIRQEHMYAQAKALIRRPFDIVYDPLLRAHLFQLGVDEYVLVIVLHHLIADGWSIRIFMREITLLYEALLYKQPTPLAPLLIHYADFALWQRQWLQDSVIAQKMVYWKNQLKNIPAILQLPTDHPRPPLQTFRGAQYHFSLAQSDSQGVITLGQQTSTTAFMILLTTLKILLYRYTHQTDIVVGSGIANRNQVETENLIGFVVNTLVLRTQLTEQLTFRELLERVRVTTLGAYANSDVPFEKLLEELHVQRDPSYPPLLQVTFTFQNLAMPPLRLPNLTLNQIHIDSSTAKFDLELYLENLPEGFTGFLEYNTDLFKEQTIIQIIEFYRLLLHAALLHPDQQIGSLISAVDHMQRSQKMDQQKIQRDTDRGKLKATKRKKLVYSQENVIKKHNLQEGQSLPLVIQPQMNNVDLVDWISHHHDEIASALQDHGGILFRDFQVESLTAFEQFTQAIHPQLLNYKERSTQRSNVSNNVYTSTDYPADQPIPLHNELSYSHAWPLKIAFFSMQTAQRGGETPIADSRKVLQLIPPTIRERFQRKDVMYVRNYGDGIDLSWQTAFQTTNKAEVEQYCRDAGIEFEWKDEDHLKTRQVRQSVAHHPVTGETVWFNQAHLFHISGLTANVREALVATFKEEDLPRNAYYGDGTPLESETLMVIRQAYQQATISFPWQQGDILLLDNMLVAHGRAPYTGTRKVVVTMTEPFNSLDSDQKLVLR
ncbi:condensation domain-containing protein [Dictyobacter arantiisoli]|uniref:Condensation domain-containing protein n=1 Tax=Dictyobacter arantiisoli TaxID=2014874 RepID=A0A5A5T9D2_9CHLR|nr:condensation domain-containing protein [Dictyobacter arantiisoli]GCF07998.1 hypothetical protein KDI_15620 [Dictyobacter arantiisoli]